MKKGFEDSQKSTFSYWFAHWCAFQLTALVLHVWKVKYLFHDIEKPWLKLFLPYSKVRKLHREHNKHHLEYGKIHGYRNVDWEALCIDWECSRFTKISQPLNARENAEKYLKKPDLSIHYAIQMYCLPMLDKLNL